MKPSLLPKTFVSSLAFVTIVAMSAPSAFAANGAAESAQANRLAAVKAKGDTDITTRITSLFSLIAKVSAATKLSGTQKSSLVTEMQGEIAGLTALKTRLDAETDVAAGRTDFQNIFSQHYVYAFYLPRVDRIIAADAESEAVIALTSLASTIQAGIDQASAKGTDVAALKAKLDDMKAKTASANTESQHALTALLPLTASGHPGNKTTVQGAATSIKAARSDLETARTDARMLVASLKKDLKLQ